MCPLPSHATDRTAYASQHKHEDDSATLLNSPSDFYPCRRRTRRMSPAGAAATG